jgi:predicted phosphodiesterase
MSEHLKKLLERNRDKKNSVEAKVHIVHAKEQKAQELPKNKPLNTKTGQADQCFIIIPDVHSYLRDVKAFDLTMAALPILNEKYNVTKVVQLGDLIEAGEVKSHPVNNVYDTNPSYADELDWAINQFWKPVMKACPDANYYGLLGNHEHRLNMYLAKRLGANDLSTTMYENYNPIKIYEDMGIHMTPYGNEDSRDGILEIFPGLVCVHGWSFSINCAKAHLDKLMGGCSIIHGHTHRIQYYEKRNAVNNTSVGAWSIGALTKMNLAWQRGIPCDHTLGFAIVLTHGDTFNVFNMRINATKSDKRKLQFPDGQVLEI